MFETIERGETAVDACARSLREAILRGDLAPGARLPAERRLAASFGVNRITLRAALARLAAAHLLEVRQGSGYRVTDFRREGGPDLIGGLVELADDSEQRLAVLDDLLRVRRAMARAVLEKLPPRDPALLAPFDAAVEHLAAVVARGDTVHHIVEADLAVVAALVAATESPVLQLCFNPVQRTLRELPALGEAMFRTPERNVAAWRAVRLRLDGPPLTSGELDQLVGLLATRDQETLDHLSP